MNNHFVIAMVTLLNSPRLTSFGEYIYRQISQAEAKALVGSGFRSAIGHESTARMLSDLLGVTVETSRMIYRQKTGEQAIVFELNRRPPEGAVLGSADIINLGFKFGLLTRVS